MKDFEFKPFGRKVLVKKTGVMKLWDSAIVQVDTAKNVPLLGEVIEAGEGEYSDKTGEWMETRVKVGDNIVFPDEMGVLIRSHNQELLLLLESDILGTY